VATPQRYTHLEVEDLQAQVADLPANHLSGTSEPDVHAARCWADTT
jgi:hypothetical protein